MVRVKICGLTREEDVDLAVSMGADALGFISGFTNSPRNISLGRVHDLASRVPPLVSTVLVTTSDVISREEAAVKRTGVDTLQLYGDGFNPSRVRDSFSVRVIRPYLIRSGQPSDGPGIDGFDALLTDTFMEGRPGGTGAVSDWGTCKRIRDKILPVPLILSGGLRPENVADAVSAVRPFAVDVSSGVERSPGIKDPQKVGEFIRRAKEADLT